MAYPTERRFKVPVGYPWIRLLNISAEQHICRGSSDHSSNLRIDNIAASTIYFAGINIMD
jgi:hypothetical protein